MDFTNQQSSIYELQKLAESRKHNILIDGSIGSGKTYLAKQYANMLGIDDFHIIESKVSAVKDMIESCYQIVSPILICIENLDTGVDAVSYSLLKFLEEPSDNVYIVVTCRNIKCIPDTIISRSAVVSVPPIMECDLVHYAQSKDKVRFDEISNLKLWQCIKSTNDIDTVFSLDQKQLEYIVSLKSIIYSNDPVSTTLWKIQKFPDGTSTPIKFIVQYLMSVIDSKIIWRSGYKCIKSLSSSRISTNAAVSRFLLDIKYLQN